MTPLYLSRVRLRTLRGEALSAIAPLLVPTDPKKRPGHAHRVLWLLFQGTPDSARDFLWRDEGNGRYLILSRRLPTDPNKLFDIDTKEFAPDLAPGDRLKFALRVNPVIRIDQDAKRKTAKGRETPKRKKVDVVMHALKSVTTTTRENGRAIAGRAIERDAIAAKTMEEWFRHQGGRFGFTPVKAPTVAGYTQVPLERGRERRAGFSTVDLSGEIEITEPSAFLSQLPDGFGSARAFGCGLMLIRRA